MGGLFNRDKSNQWIPRGEQAFEKQQFEDACDHYVKAVETEPNNVAAMLRLAHLQQYIGRYSDALMTYLKVVVAEPSNTNAWTQLAILQAESGAYDQAINSINHVQLSPLDTFLLSRKCEWSSRICDYQGAAEIAKRLIATNPENEYYKSLYAENLLRSGQNADAKNAYLSLMKEYPKHAAKYAKDAAFCAELMDETDEACRLYAQTSAQDSLSRYRKAQLDESAGRFADAAYAYAAIQQKEGTDEIHLTLRRIYCLFWSGKYTEAIAELENLLSRGLESADLWYLLGTLSFMTGSIKRAAECFEKTARLAPEMGWVWQMKGIAEFFSGKYANAIESINHGKAILSDKESGDAFFEKEDLNLLEKEQKKQVEEIKFSEENPYLTSIEACCLAAIGNAEAADKAALSVLEADPSRIDMELLHLRLLAASGRYQASAETYTRVNELLPDDYTLLFEHAETEMLLGKFSQAAEIFNSLNAEYPENPLLLARLIFCLTCTGDYDTAKETADSAITKIPNDAAALRMAGNASFYAGAYDDAITYYQKVTELQPENGYAYLYLGRSYEMLGRYTEAKEAFSSAGAYLAENQTMVFHQAQAAANTGNMEEAAALYTSIIQSYPDLKGPAEELALISASLGRHEETKNAIAAATSLGNTNFMLSKLGGDTCMLLMRFDEAVTYYTEALALNPDNKIVKVALAKAYSEKGSYGEALKTVTEALAADPQNPELLILKARCELNLGNWETAEDTLHTLCSLTPDAPEPLVALAAVLEHQRKYDEMLEVFSTYLDIQPENINVFRKIADIYLMQGNYEEAISGFDLILEAQPNDLITLCKKAEALMALGKWDETAKLCADILKDDENNAGIRRLYAKSLTLSGDSESALKEYVTILKTDRTNTEALFSYGDLLSRTGNYSKAFIAFDRIIHSAKVNHCAYVEKAFAAVKEGKPEMIFDALKASISVSSGNPYLLAGLGYFSALSGRPSEALTFFEKAENAGCTDVDVYSTRALIYLGQNRYDLALAAADKATEMSPANAFAWRMKAKALEGLDRLEEAVECYKFAITGKEVKANTEAVSEDLGGATKKNEPATVEEKSAEKKDTALAAEQRMNRRKAFGKDNLYSEESTRANKQEPKKHGFIIN